MKEIRMLQSRCTEEKMFFLRKCIDIFSRSGTFPGGQFCDTIFPTFAAAFGIQKIYQKVDV